jgi:hypothetical protein
MMAISMPLVEAEQGKVCESLIASSTSPNETDPLFSAAPAHMPLGQGLESTLGLLYHALLLI